MILLEPNAPPVERFIVEIRDGINPQHAFELLVLVLKEGRVSTTNGKAHHCHHIAGTIDKNEIHVACIPNEKSERFIIYKP
jgi:hypothetical protein